jgi:hypothetical protein
VVETLEEKMYAFEEADEYFIARDDILHRLSCLLGGFMPRKTGVDVRREGHRSR